MTPPKPASRPARVGLWRYLRLFRRDILSAQPAHLYRAWMAEFRTPFFRSYLCNDPALVDHILKKAPGDFPKSDRVREGLAPLLGRSVFVTNGEEWQRQRRIIDPAFRAGGPQESYAPMLAAAEAMRDRLRATDGKVEIEAEASRAAADVIFRTMFSVPIEDRTARAVFDAFRTYQRSQPLLNLAAFLPLPRWFPRLHRPRATKAAARIRALLAEMTESRSRAMAEGAAPDDLATRLFRQTDSETGQGFSSAELADQMAIFFLAGHETSAAALGWALYLLASHPEVQDRARAEAAGLPDAPDMGDVMRLGFLRDIFRETLRLYPPVPMMVRENLCPVTFRGRAIGPGAQFVLSPWHLHRHERLWQQPDEFEPDRWRRADNAAPAATAFVPFSAGPRTCPGASFAMLEGLVFLAILLRDLRFEVLPAEPPPVPVAHLTVRAQNGIHLRVTPVPR
ncbi:MAG: cytochrome P450 [Paracoccaceae bacterium]